ncbi:hypothetical protein LCGC14_1835520 [marine sediment metagenome]|uniref:Uncharacterized protein n=1 Tax=marine sediment metagenome TaxID=412755 RepID=A0A0F9JED6_9ZZZZ
MSTVYYACGKCDGEIGSAHQITWLADGPYHPECARAKELASLRREATMKTYTIKRLHDGEVICHVTTYRTGAEAHHTVTKLFHLVYHSPDGFDTGYGGPGPADLALSILADHFEERAALQPAAGRLQCWAVHQLFKEVFISPNMLASGEDYVITEEQIVAWLASLQKCTDAKQG